ncbi:MAG: HAD family phosphatase [Myxococcales bacterium]|nr:HAD family phosphatase [Myxococcales bacterium]
MALACGSDGRSSHGGARRVSCAVIFDLDGLLADTEPVWRASAIELLGRRGHQVDESLRPRVMGRHPIAVAQIYIEHFGLDDSAEALAAERLEIVRSLYARGRVDPKPGAHALCADVARAGAPMIVASGSPTSLVGEVLGALSLAIAQYVGSDLVERGKPAPDIFFLAARRLDVPIERCVVLEDSALGVEAALASGARCVAVPGPETPRDRVQGADLIVDSLEQLDFARLASIVR